LGLIVLVYGEEQQGKAEIIDALRKIEDQFGDI